MKKKYLSQPGLTHQARDLGHEIMITLQKTYKTKFNPSHEIEITLSKANKKKITKPDSQ